MTADPQFNPFPGLRPFQPDEDHLFFGREREIDEVLKRLRTHRFLAVIGDSGSGKSSLIRSGAIPALHSGFMASAGSSWRVAILRPGEDPIGNLAAALNSPDVLGAGGEDAATYRTLMEVTLRRSGLGLVENVQQARLPQAENLLVVVDQFEELFRFKRLRQLEHSRDDSLGFVRLLLEGTKQQEFPIFIVLTMRSDFLGDCIELPGLPEAINEGHYLVPRMTRGELRQAITGPVAVGGGEISPALVTRLLNEVGDDSDRLPVLQHSLMRTWESWVRNGHGQPMAQSDYEAIGTMREALSRHADEAFAELRGEREQMIAEKLFRALTDAGSDARGVRRPTSLRRAAVLCEAPEDEVARVVEVFRRPGRSFLTPPPSVDLEADSILDLSHESLMRIWTRLAGWADDERRSGDAYRTLSEAAGRYEAGTAGLWRDPELALALQWREEQRPTRLWAEQHDEHFDRAMDFLDRSRAERDRQRRRRIVLTASFLAFVLLVSLIIAALGLTARRRARQVQNNSVMVAAESASDPAVKALLITSLGDDPDLPDRLGAVRRIAEETVIPASILRGHRAAVSAVAFSPDGGRILTASQDGTARLWRSDGTGQPLELEHGAAVGAAAFSPDGSRVVTAAADGLARVWRADGSGDPLELRHGAAVRAAVFSADGRLVLTASGDRFARLWNVAGAGEAPVELPHQAEVLSAEFSPDGRRILTLSEDGVARLWPADGSGEPTRLPAAGARSAAFSPDGTRIVTTSGDRRARIWAADGKGAPRELEHRGRVLRAAFSPDGGSLVTAAEDGLIRIWRLDGSVEPVELDHGDPPLVATFSHDGARLLTATETGPAHLRRGDGGGPSVALAGGGAPLSQAVFSPDGATVATAYADGTIRVWQLERPAEPRVFEIGHPLLGGAFSFEGGRIVTAAADAAVILDPDGGAPPLVLWHDRLVSRAAFSPDDSRVATASFDGVARIWDAAGGSEPLELRGHDGRLWSAVFDAAGSRVVTASADGTARVWSLDGAAGPVVLSGHRDAVLDASFSPDGERVVTASADGTARVWPAGGGEGGELRGHEGAVRRATFDATGRRIATASDDGTVRLWKAGGGRATAVCPHDDRVVSVEFLPGGELLSAAADGEVRLWQPGCESFEVLVEYGPVVTADADVAGGRLMTAASDGTARIWRLGWKELIDYFRDATNACLTPAERERLLAESPSAAAAASAECEERHGRLPG